MAVQEEIFSADVKISFTGEKDALDRLNKLVKGSLLEVPWKFAKFDKQLVELEKRLQGKSIKIGFDIDSGKLGKLPKQAEESGKKVSRAFSSAITSGIGEKTPFDEIQAELAKLPRTGDAAATALKRSFKEIRAESKIAFGKGIIDGPETINALADLSIKIEDYKRHLSGKEINDAAQEAAELNYQYDLLNKTVRQSGSEFLRTAAPVHTASTSLVTFGDRLGGTAKLLFSSGQRLQGLREIYAGTSSSSNRLVNTLDRSIKIMDGTSRSASLLGKGIEFVARATGITKDGLTGTQRSLTNLAKATDGSIILLQKQVSVLRELSKQQGVSPKTLSDLKAYEDQLKRVELAVSQVATTASTGGDVTAALARQRTEVEKLNLQYNELEQNADIPPELLEEYGKLAKATGDIDSKTQSLNQTHRKVVKEREKAVEAEKKLKAEQKKTGDASEGYLSKILNLFKRSSSGAKEFTGEVQRVAPAIDQAGDALRKFELSSKQAFKVEALAEFTGALGAQFVGRGIDFITDKLREIPAALISLGSSADETENRFSAVFGNLTDQAAAFAEELGSAVGRNEFAIKDSLSSFQSFSVGLGFANDDAFTMSTTLQSLALDFASFNNLADDDAIGRFIAAMSGSGEVLDRYGINIKDAALGQKLQALGLAESTAKATEQQKAIARLAIIYDTMTQQGAVGDATTTAQSFANQLKNLSQSVEQTGTEIGQKLLPTLAPFLRLANIFVDNVAPQIVAGFDRINAVLVPFAEGLALAFETGDFGGLIDSFDPLIDGILGIIDQAFDWGWGLVENISGGILDAADSILDSALTYVGDLWASFLEPGSPPETGPLSSIDKWATGLLDTFMSGAGDVDTSFLVKALDPVQDALRSLDVDDATLAKAQNLILSINDTLSSTGQVNEQAFGQLDKLLGDDNKALSSYLRNTAQVESSTKDIAKLQRQVALARARGEDATDLREQIRAARFQQQAAAQAADSNERVLQLQQKQARAAGRGSASGTVSDETLDTELAAVEERLQLGLIAEEEAQRDRLRLYQKYAEEARKSGDKLTAKQLADQAKLIEKSLEKEADISESASEKTLDEELAAIKQRADLGLITEEQAQQERVRLLRQYAEKAREENNLAVARDLASQANEIEKALEEQRLAEQEAKKRASDERKGLEKKEREARKAAEKKTAEEIYQEELSQLQAKIDAGIISEEDAAKERLKIEKKLFDSVTEEGRSASEDNIANIKKFQAVVDSFKQKNRSDGDPLGLGGSFDFSKILGDYEAIAEDKAKDIGNKIADGTVRGIDEFKTKVADKFSEIVDNVKSKLDDPAALNLILGFKNFLDIFNKVKGVLTGEGLFARLLAPLRPFLKIIDLVAEPVLKAARAVGVFLDHFGLGGKIIKKFLGFALNLTGPLGILLNIWLNWDAIVLAFNTTIDALRDIWKGFTDRLGGSESALQKLSDFWESLTGVFDTAKEKLTGFFSALLDGDISGAFASLNFEGFDFASVTELGSEIGSALWESTKEVASGLFAELGEYILGLLPEDISEKIQEKFQGLIDLKDRFTEFTSTLTGDFSPVFDTVSEKLRSFGEQVGPKLTELGEKLSIAWDKLKEAFARLGAVYEESLGPAIGRLLVALGLTDEESGNLNVSLSSFADFLTGAGLDLLIGSIVGAIDKFILVVDAVSIGIEYVTPLIEYLATAWGLFIDDVALKIEGFKATADFFIGIFQGIYDTLVGNSIIPDLVTGIGEWFGKLLEGPVSYATDFKNRVIAEVQLLLDESTRISEDFLQVGLDIVNFLRDGVELAWTGLSSYFEGLITGLKDQWSSFTSGLEFPSLSGDGGFIPGFASGAWEIPQDTLAMVHKGEMIVPAGPAELLRGMLQDINLAGIGNINLNVGPAVASQPSVGDKVSSDQYQINVPVAIYGNADRATGVRVGNDVANTVTARLRAKGRS